MSNPDDPDLIIRLIGHRPLAGELDASDFHLVVESVQSALRAIASPDRHAQSSGQSQPPSLLGLKLRSIEFGEVDLQIEIEIRPDGRECESVALLVRDLLSEGEISPQCETFSAGFYLWQLRKQLPAEVRRVELVDHKQGVLLTLDRIERQLLRWPPADEQISNVDVERYLRATSDLQ